MTSSILLPLLSLFLLVVSGWSLFISGSACCIWPFLTTWLYKNREQKYFIQLHEYEQFFSRLPLKISMDTNAWKAQAQQILQITWMWSVVYKSKLENITCTISMGSTVCLLQWFYSKSRLWRWKQNSIYNTRLLCRIFPVFQNFLAAEILGSVTSQQN